MRNISIRVAVDKLLILILEICGASDWPFEKLAHMAQTTNCRKQKMRVWISEGDVHVSLDKEYMKHVYTYKFIFIYIYIYRNRSLDADWSVLAGWAIKCVTTE